MKVAVGCDHTVTEIKNQVIHYLENKGYEVVDCGTMDHQRTHYPIYGKRVGEKVALKEVDCGIVLCGTGIGIANAASKVKGVRCVLAQDAAVVRYAREQLNANVLGFGGRVVGWGQIEELIDIFFSCQYQPSIEKETKIARLDALNKDNPACGIEGFFDDLLLKWDQGEYHD